MEIRKEKRTDCYAIKLIIEIKARPVGHCYLYVIRNDLHEQPYGFIEDVYVEEGHRSHGLGTALIRAAIFEARANGCYKLICTSRFGKEGIHTWYRKLGFVKYGAEFRMDLV